MQKVLRLATPLLLGVSVLANGILGYFVWDTRSAMRKTDDVIDEQLAEAEARLDAMTAEALGQVSQLATIQRSVDSLRTGVTSDLQELESDLTDLESAIFGPVGAPPGNLDALGDLERELSDLRFCANSAFASLQSNSERLVAWVGIVISGGFAVRPSTFVPRCF